MKPLEGITVLALEHAISAPFCTRQLADLGARVIKIERPEGGDFARYYDERVKGMSSHFVWTNRSKESLALDLKSPEAPPILKSLLKKTDVLIQNLAPGAASRLGLSFEKLHPLFPQLIVCDISGYGDDPEHPGPYRDKKAYDLLIQSESGFLSITGTKQENVKAGCSIADISAGMYAYSNILAALLERQKTGLGKRIDISMLECMTEWMGFPLYYTSDHQTEPQKSGAAHATIFPYGPFSTGDNKQVLFAVQNDREWTSFCDLVLERPELAQSEYFINNSNRIKNRELLTNIILQVFSHYTQNEIILRLEQAKIANANVNTLADVWNHPQLKARQRWTEVDTPVGKIPTLKPVGSSHSDDFQLTKVPALGEHTESILKELGFRS
ncbi:CaiB/BaiF CoA transferase family protein [Acinetobacter sp. TSRC1-2]|uniref:CaiB/BaiF CoA transferase family protein n=1 Tax=unclassified Acinetobacter TaxID=196816 RepID=UPI003CF4BE6F